MLVLHTYFCSSASYRVRIALEFKGLACEAIPVHLVRGGGAQHSAALAALNPAELVPVRVDGEVTLTQSRPISNISTRSILRQPFYLRMRRGGRGCAPPAGTAFAAHRRWPIAAWCVVRGAWCVVRGAWCVVRGAWCLVRGAWCLVPQIYNAERFGVAQTAYPIIRRIGQAGLELSTFQRAAAEAQADAA